MLIVIINLQLTAAPVLLQTLLQQLRAAQGALLFRLFRLITSLLPLKRFIPRPICLLRKPTPFGGTPRPSTHFIRHCGFCGSRQLRALIRDEVFLSFLPNGTEYLFVDALVGADEIVLRNEVFGVLPDSIAHGDRMPTWDLQILPLKV